MRPNALVLTSAWVGPGEGTGELSLMKRAEEGPAPFLMSTAFIVLGGDDMVRDVVEKWWERDARRAVAVVDGWRKRDVLLRNVGIGLRRLIVLTALGRGARKASVEIDEIYTVRL